MLEKLGNYNPLDALLAISKDEDTPLDILLDKKLQQKRGRKPSLLLWWTRVDKVRTFLLQLKPKILNWRKLNPSKKFTMEIFKLMINCVQ